MAKAKETAVPCCLLAATGVPSSENANNALALLYHGSGFGDVSSKRPQRTALNK
jgi:hypothetical protein